MSARILVVGGAGSFGRRLVESLIATTDADVIVAGRERDAAETLADSLRRRHAGRVVEAVRLDRNQAGAAEIAALDPHLVIDAAGPFQGADLRFASAVIDAGRHYLDIADARDFLAAFASLDERARGAGVIAISGASSTPALSHAALDELVAGWRRVDRVEMAISPGNRAPRGLSVVSAILSCAGAPIRVLNEGRWEERSGWGLPACRRMPGLGPRWLSLCETSDLDLIPARLPMVRTALFRAGLELMILHLGLCALGLLRRVGLAGSLARFAGPARSLAAAFERFGTDRGGMTVEAQGLDEAGEPARAIWSLVAEAGDGPNVPILPALAFAKAILEGRPPAPPGARAAAGLLTLEAFGKEASRFSIRTRISRASPAAVSVFERAIGPGVERLPEIVRRVHDPRPHVRLAGGADIDGAANAGGRLIARLFGFPATLSNAPAEVEIERRGDVEVWTRRFVGKGFSSRMEAGEAPCLIRERFGPVAFDLDVTPTATGFCLHVVGWRVLGVPAPLRFAPRSQARAFAHADGAYGFDVSISLAPFGRLVRYRGRLTPI